MSERSVASVAVRKAVGEDAAWAFSMTSPIARSNWRMAHSRPEFTGMSRGRVGTSPAQTLLGSWKSPSASSIRRPSTSHMRLAVVDLGGGSTELAVGEGLRCLFAESLLLGALRRHNAAGVAQT